MNLVFFQFVPRAINLDSSIVRVCVCVSVKREGRKRECLTLRLIGRDVDYEKVKKHRLAYSHIVGEVSFRNKDWTGNLSYNI